MNTHNVWISKLGYSVPGTSLAQQDIADWLAQRLPDDGICRKRLQSFSRHAGIDSRHVAFDLDGDIAHRLYPVGAEPATTGTRMDIYAELAPQLALDAITHACDGEELGHISHIITVSCTGLLAPGLDVALMQALNLPNDTVRRAISYQGCCAAITAFGAARDICLAHADARVLVVCCEISSLHLQLDGRDENLIGACLFADGASAAIIESSPHPIGKKIRVIEHRNELIADSQHQMAWHISNHGFSLVLSPEIAQSLTTHINSVVDRLIGDTALADIHHWVIHPGGPRILNALEKQLELPADALTMSREQLRTAGNRSSGTVMAVLHDSARTAHSGDNFAMLAFGPGLTVEAMTLEQH